MQKLDALRRGDPQLLQKVVVGLVIGFALMQLGNGNPAHVLQLALAVIVIAVGFSQLLG